MNWVNSLSRSRLAFKAYCKRSGRRQARRSSSRYMHSGRDTVTKLKPVVCRFPFCQRRGNVIEFVLLSLPFRKHQRCSEARRWQKVARSHLMLAVHFHQSVRVASGQFPVLIIAPISCATICQTISKQPVFFGFIAARLLVVNSFCILVANRR